jgi:hypothetical protein
VARYPGKRPELDCKRIEERSGYSKSLEIGVRAQSPRPFTRFQLGIGD